MLVFLSQGVAKLGDERDVFNRPVIFIRARRHFPGNQAADERLAVYLLERAIERLGEEGEQVCARSRDRPLRPPPSTVAHGRDGEGRSPRTADEPGPASRAPQVLGVFDMDGFTAANVDPGFVRFVVDLFFVYYPKRIGQVVFVNAPWLFRPVWAGIAPGLGKYARLVSFVDEGELGALLGEEGMRGYRSGA